MPPKTGPIITPMLKHIGISRNARDWNLLQSGIFTIMALEDAYFFSWTISAIIVLMTPTFPFSAPPRVRKKAAWRNDVENPKPTQERQVPRRPISKTIFLPPQSESATLPHNMAVTNCAAVKLPWSIPACAAMAESASEGSNDFSW